MLAPYFDFLRSLGTQEFVRLFWFFFILELPRYVILDYVAIFAHYLHRRSQGDARADARRNLFLEKPLVSVIVPGKDEGENFYQLARTLQEQTYQNYELIVVDDGSEDDSALIGRDLEEKGAIDVFLRNEVRGGKASAANLCLRYARGEYVVHLDADCSLDRDALERLLIPFYLDEKVGAVGGSRWWEPRRAE
jgi:cellulose synthase/poly-beta-1,6-N-acetylglucosamine synthase-like glycosyltransferase